MGVIEQLEKYMVEQTNLSLDAQRARTLEQIGKTALPMKAREAIEAESAKGDQQSNPQNPSGADTGQLADMQPMPAKIPGGDMGQGAAIQGLGPSQAPQAVPTPIEEQKPGYTAQTTAHRMGVMFPWQRAKYKNVTQYSKDEASVNTHSNAIAMAYDSIQSGNAKSGDEYNKAVKSAIAELGPFAAEAVAEGKAIAVGLNRNRMIVEKENQTTTFNSIIEGGGTPAQAQIIGKAANGTLTEKAEAIRKSGYTSNSVQASDLLIQIRNQELSNKRRAGEALEGEARRRQLALQQQGLPGAMGWRQPEEVVGQSLTEAQGAFRAAVAGDENLKSMIPQIQGNISKLSGDEWLFTEKSWEADKFEGYKTQDIIIDFATADGRWIDEGLSREKALEKRRAAATRLEKIAGIPIHTEQIRDGKLEFDWGKPEGINAVRINELYNMAIDHESWEAQNGKPLRDFDYSPKKLVERRERELTTITGQPGGGPTPQGSSRLGQTSPIPTSKQYGEESRIAKEALVSEIKKARDSVVGLVDKKRKDIAEKQKKFQESIGRFGK